MSKERLHKFEPRFVRLTLNEAVEQAASLLESERKLVFILKTIDEKRLFTRYGFKSLLGFCTNGLRLSRIQAQLLVTDVRRQQTLNSASVIHRADVKHRDFAQIANLETQLSLIDL